MIKPSWMHALCFEDLGIDDDDTTVEGHLHINNNITYVLLSLEVIIFFVCVAQLIRFCGYNRLYLKKVVHVLIMLQMMVCLSQAVELPRKYNTFLHEISFAFCGAIYIIVILFWVDFYYKLRWARPLKFLKRRGFIYCIATSVVVYVTFFSLLQYFVFGIQSWKLTAALAYWHLAFYITSAIAMVYIALRVTRAIYQHYVNVRLRFFRRTAKILVLVCFCFILRSLGGIVFVCIHHAPHYLPNEWHTQIGFVILYTLDRIIPVVVFMILMRNTPGKTLETSTSLNNVSVIYMDISS